jgi:hypothetical protein
MQRREGAALVLLAGLAGLAAGGGPHVVADGKALCWDASKNPIAYEVHTGAAPKKEADAFAALVQDAFDAWASVKTAKLTFSQKKVSGKALSLEGFSTIEKQGPNTVVMDVGGDIVATLLGEANRKFIHGWGVPIDDGARIVRFYAIINAHESLESSRKGVVLHELGHVMGLDHSQITAAFAKRKGDQRYAPVMFPTSFDPPLTKLRPDDEAWLSRLYPSDAYAKQYGVIKGKVVTGKAKAVRGANVVAVRDGDEEHRVSCVSDYLGDGSGAFEIPVKIGDYWLYVEPIRKSFRGSSRVGLHAEKPDGHSFKERVEPKKFPNLLTVKAGQATDADLPVDLQQ